MLQLCTTGHPGTPRTRAAGCLTNNLQDPKPWWRLSGLTCASVGSIVQTYSDPPTQFHDQVQRKKTAPEIQMSLVTPIFSASASVFHPFYSLSFCCPLPPTPKKNHHVLCATAIHWGKPRNHQLTRDRLARSAALPTRGMGALNPRSVALEARFS
jgi:hypothetical protein